VIDRPAEMITFEENKEYVQPQWILDCINGKKLLPVAEYRPGRKLPPHVSPFYEYSEDGEIKPKLKVNKPTENEQEAYIENTPAEVNEENKDLREMLISRNKKKILNRIREEKLKKKRVKTK
jgi:pescadillo protein